METLEAIGKRCSLKTNLSPKTIDQKIIDKVLTAAHLAPSARNKQPWRFVVVQEKKTVDKLVDTAFFGPNEMVKQAPVLVAVCARPEDDLMHDGKEYYLFDVGLAVENMLIAATDLGLVTHPLISFNETEAKRILQIPGDVRIVIITPLAYPPEASYDDAAMERLSQRSRKDLKEVAYLNTWGE